MNPKNLYASPKTLRKSSAKYDYCLYFNIAKISKRFDVPVRSH